MIQRFEIVDSRGVEWKVVVSGPYRSGSLTVGESLESLPQKWMARFTRPDAKGESIEIELYAADTSAEELQELLEQEPEWVYETWAVRPRWVSR